MEEQSRNHEAWCQTDNLSKDTFILGIVTPLLLKSLKSATAILTNHYF